MATIRLVDGAFETTVPKRRRPLGRLRDGRYRAAPAAKAEIPQRETRHLLHQACAPMPLRSTISGLGVSSAPSMSAEPAKVDRSSAHRSPQGFSGAESSRFGRARG